MTNNEKIGELFTYLWNAENRLCDLVKTHAPKILISKNRDIVNNLQKELLDLRILHRENQVKNQERVEYCACCEYFLVNNKPCAINQKYYDRVIDEVPIPCPKRKEIKC